MDLVGYFLLRKLVSMMMFKLNYQTDDRGEQAILIDRSLKVIIKKTEKTTKKEVR